MKVVVVGLFLYTLLFLGAVQAACDSPDDVCWCILRKPEMYTPCPDKCFEFKSVTPNGVEKLVEIDEGGNVYLTPIGQSSGWQIFEFTGPHTWGKADDIITDISKYGNDRYGCKQCEG